MGRKGVLVVGSANMDLVVTAGSFPEAGETVFGSSFGMFPGGKGANQAVACAKLGGKVTFIGKMGHDVFRERLTRSMRHDGVLVNGVAVDAKAPTGIALITVDIAGQNKIVVVSGSNMLLRPADIEERRAAFNNIRVLLLQLEIPIATVRKAAMLAREKGVTVILNPAPARRLPRTLLGLVDYLTPNQTELHQLSGLPVNSTASIASAARSLLAAGVKHVIVTLGRQGSLLVDRDCVKLFPAYDVKAVDTTAAGDAFSGALAFGLASGRSYLDAIPFANAVAALCVTRVGAQGSMPTMKELQSFID